jgi:hypothetical protein
LIWLRNSFENCMKSGRNYWRNGKRHWKRCKVWIFKLKKKKKKKTNVFEQREKHRWGSLLNVCMKEINDHSDDYDRGFRQ